MHRILKLVEGEIRGLHEAAYLLGLFALLSTFLALFRDRLLAGVFGAGETLDIYYAAFRIPDLLYVSVASLVSLFILVPVLQQQDNLLERYKTISTVVLGFSVLIVSLSVILWFALPKLLPVFVPALWQQSPELLLSLTRILLLQPFFLGLSGILSSVVQSHGRFMLYAIAPLLYNVSIIFGIVALNPIFGVQGIVYGVVLGAFLHLLVQFPFVFRLGYFRPYSVQFRLKEFWDIVSVSIPRTLSLAFNHFALLVLIGFASTVGIGAVSVFSLAFNLQAAPLSIIGASYSVAAFPILARYFSHGKVEEFAGQIIAASRHIVFWSIPILSLTIVLRAHIVRVALGSGAFDWADTRLTAAVLAMFLVSLAAQALSLLFVRGYYAAGETVKPLVVNALTAIGIVVGAFLFLKLFNSSETWRFFIERLFRVEGIPGTAVLMLPLAYSVFMLLNIATFIALFTRDFGTVLWDTLRRTMFESFSASVVAGFATHQMLRVLSSFLDINTFVGVFSIGFFAGLVGIVAGIVVLALLGSRELEEVLETLHKKFWRNSPFFSVDSQD